MKGLGKRANLSADKEAEEGSKGESRGCRVTVESDRGLQTVNGYNGN